RGGPPPEPDRPVPFGGGPGKAGPGVPARRAGKALAGTGDRRPRNVEGHDREAPSRQLLRVVAEAGTDLERATAEAGVGIQPRDQMRIGYEVGPRDDGGPCLGLAVEHLEPRQSVPPRDGVPGERTRARTIHRAILAREHPAEALDQCRHARDTRRPSEAEE